MTQAEMHEEHSEHAGPSASDVIVSGLAALAVGGVVWGGGVGVVAGLNYAGEYFGIHPPATELINTAIQTGYVVGPILAGLVAAWLTYRLVIRLP